MRITEKSAAAAIVLCVLTFSAALAQQSPEDIYWHLEAAAQEQIGDEIVASGNVYLIYGNMKLQADKLTFNRTTHICTAEGNVTVYEETRKLTGDMLEMNLDTGRGDIYGAVAFEDPSYFFEGVRIEMLSRDRYILYRGFYTTCNQAIPYWGIRSARAKVKIGGYARFQHLRFTVRNAPVFYLPYWVWPVKRDRTSGLLIPEPGYSQYKGSSLRNQFFWVLGESADATITYDFFEKYGSGVGLEFRLKTGETSEGYFDGYYIRDRLSDRSRHFTRFEYWASPWSGRFRAAIEATSDLSYYRNFEYFLDHISKRRISSNVFYSRGWNKYSFNIIGEHEANFVTDEASIKLTKLPEVSFRRRSSALWENSPVNLSFEWFTAHFRKEIPTIDPATQQKTDETVWDYERVVFRPVLSLPIKPAPWIDLNFDLQGYGAYYTSSLDPTNKTQLVDDSLFHRYWLGGMRLHGPRFMKLFKQKQKGYFERFKHVIEPQVRYAYRTEDDESRSSRVPRFDGYDGRSFFEHRVSMSLVQYLYGKPHGDNASPAEVAKFTVSQEYSLVSDRYLSYRYDGSGNLVERSYFGPVYFSLRYYPLPRVGIDASAVMHYLYREISVAQIAGELTTTGGTSASIAWSYGRSLPSSDVYNHQLRFNARTSAFSERFSVQGEISYDVEGNRIQHQRYAMIWRNQCSAFIFDVTQKKLGVFDDLEFHFAIELKDVGRILSF